MERKLAEVPVNINGVICDLYGRTITGPVKIVGSMSRTDVGVGGGPVFPPDGGEGGEKPPPDSGNRPTFPIWGPPGSNFPDKPGYPPVVGGGPIYPPEQVPPEMKPPEPPPPGTTAPVPPPAGSGGWPTTGIVPPPYVVMNYPGVGPIYVAPPPHAEPAA